MAVVRRSTASAPAEKASRAATPAAPVLALTLPDEPSEVSHNINDYYFLLHGTPKIGKTTLSTEEGGVLLLTFDPLNKSLSLLQRFVPSWNHLLAYLALLETRAGSGQYPYKRVVIDGSDLMYRHCQRQVEKDLVVGHVSEEKWGRGWDKLKDSFMMTVDRFMALPGGCWFICHSEWREIETIRHGAKTQKLMPTMKAAAEEIIVGKCDCWFAYTFNGKERVLLTEGNERIGAGNKIKGHFLTPDGRKVLEIPLGDSSAESWHALLTAFSNKQPFATLAERDGDPPEAEGGDASDSSPENATPADDEPVEIPEA